MPGGSERFSKPNVKRKLLIDGDLVVYRFACRSECAVQWTEGGEVSAVGDIDQARREATTWITDLVERLKADDYTLVFGDDEHRSFRFDLYPDYKAHRTQGRPPVHRREVEKMLRAEFPTESRPGLEADDVMGIMATMKTWVGKEERVIVTIDKDLETVPGAHFNYRKDKAVRQVSEAEADYNHLFLTLVGDTADGFKGCPGIGPKKAANVLADVPFAVVFPPHVQAHRWDRVVAAFKAKGLTEDDALLQARLARVLRASDFNFLDRKPILWTPPTL